MADVSNFELDLINNMKLECGIAIDLPDSEKLLL